MFLKQRFKEKEIAYMSFGLDSHRANEKLLCRDSPFYSRFIATAYFTTLKPLAFVLSIAV